MNFSTPTLGLQTARRSAAVPSVAHRYELVKGLCRWVYRAGHTRLPVLRLLTTALLSFLILRASRHVQCVLNFLDNVDEDGGTLVVPKFHAYLPEFCAQYAHLRKPLPWVQFPGEVEAQLLRRAHRVTMREVCRLFHSRLSAAGAQHKMIEFP